MPEQKPIFVQGGLTQLAGLGIAQKFPACMFDGDWLITPVFLDGPSRFPLAHYLSSLLPVSRLQGLAQIATAKKTVRPHWALTTPIFPTFASMVTVFQVPSVDSNHDAPFFALAQRALAALEAIRDRSAGVIFFILALPDFLPMREK